MKGNENTVNVQKPDIGISEPFDFWTNLRPNITGLGRLIGLEKLL
jgi:hypothetical protein